MARLLMTVGTFEPKSIGMAGENLTAALEPAEGGLRCEQSAYSYLPFTFVYLASHLSTVS